MFLHLNSSHGLGQLFSCKLFHKSELLLHRYFSTFSLMLVKLMFPNRYFWEAEYMIIGTILLLCFYFRGHSLRSR